MSFIGWQIKQLKCCALSDLFDTSTTKTYSILQTQLYHEILILAILFDRLQKHDRDTARGGALFVFFIPGIIRNSHLPILLAF